jgi:hypothetical protein
MLARGSGRRFGAGPTMPLPLPCPSPSKPRQASMSLWGLRPRNPETGPTSTEAPCGVATRLGVCILVTVD